jgi:hypothetical protein
MTMTLTRALRNGLEAGRIIPYLGSGMLTLVPGGSPVPATPEALAGAITAKVTVPHKIRTRLTAAAQFIENFKHRKTIVALMCANFAPEVVPSTLHCYLAGLSKLPLIVDTWYDNASETALKARKSWGQVQGLSQSEHFGSWTGTFDSAGHEVNAFAAATWRTLLYKPIGGVSPAANFLVSDTDFVEVLTEIDIQTPIPQRVQEVRAGRNFLFLGCRFNDQLQRTFARQIMKRSSDRHWAVLPGNLTRNEARFLEEQNIERIDMGLEAFAAELTGRQLAPAA